MKTTVAAMGLSALLLMGSGQSGGGAPVDASAYDDPVAYCRAVGTADDPMLDRRYRGPPVPPRILRATGLDQIDEPMLGSFGWRCADGRVLVCYGAMSPFACAGGLMPPTWSPTPAEQEYQADADEAAREICRREPDTDCAPATHCQLGCRTGEPVPGFASTIPRDERGYDPEEWEEVH